MNPNIILTKPRITEKSTMVAEHQVYTFDVARTTTKVEIKKAIKALYKVSPLKVNIVVIKPKNVMVRGKAGTRGGGKKAFVYLKKGDKIEFV